MDRFHFLKKTIVLFWKLRRKNEKRNDRLKNDSFSKTVVLKTIVYKFDSFFKVVFDPLLSTVNNDPLLPFVNDR